MNQQPKTNQLSGHIVEIYVNKNKRFGKVLCDPHYLNVDLDGMEDIHLGDRVILFYEGRTIDIKPGLGINNQEEES
ncbi:MAG: hypothetical protein GF313_05280 [Caldithrix sp.]|nr:hypothetical protein [Caldithrix sp.]